MLRRHTEPICCFLAILDHFERDEVEARAQAIKKRKTPKKTPIRSKDIRSTNSVETSQVPELIEIG